MTILYPKEKNLHGTVSLLSNNNEICDERLTIEFFLLGKQWEVAWCCLPDFISEEKLKSDWKMHLNGFKFKWKIYKPGWFGATPELEWPV